MNAIPKKKPAKQQFCKLFLKLRFFAGMTRCGTLPINVSNSITYIRLIREGHLLVLKDNSIIKVIKSTNKKFVIVKNLEN